MLPALRYDRSTIVSVMGGMNYHVKIHFEDGVTWLARIRRFNATSPPPPLRDHIVRSEVATLRFLERTGLPTPRVFDFALEGPDNPVGVGYILMSKLPGSSMRWAIAGSTQRRKVMQQVAEAYIKLSQFPFPQMGSLADFDPIRVGPFARESLTDFDGTEMCPLQPCHSLEEYYDAAIRLTLRLILQGEAYAGGSVDAYLVHRFLLDILPRAAKLASSLSSSVDDEPQRFYLKHPDDKGDHILVDAEYNVTGIVDWEWAYTAPKRFAFKSPMAFLPVGDFYDGKNDLGDDERTFAAVLDEMDQPDLARIVREGRVLHRFDFCCGYNMAADWSGFLGLFKGLRNALGVDDEMEWEAWRDLALQRYEKDEGLLILRDRIQA